MYDEIKNFGYYVGVGTAFCAMLPEDPRLAGAVICTTIDKYAARFHMDSSEVWDMFYDISKQVHKDYGEYAEFN